jgi:serine/threonine-protein kinase
MRARLLRLTRRVDPDPAWRDRVRDPTVRGNRLALEQLTVDVLSSPGAEQPPHLLHMLAVWLKEARGDPEPLLRAAQQRRPADVWLNCALAGALLDRNPGESVGFIRAALAKRPQSSRVHFLLGDALRRQGKNRESLASYYKSIELDPKGIPALNNLAIVLNSLGRPVEALAVLRKATELGPTSGAPYFNLGRTLKELGRIDEALAALRKATDVDPRGEPARRELEQVLTIAARDPGRDPSYRRTIAWLTETFPDDHDAWNHCASLWVQTGDRARYREHCCQMLDRFSRSTVPEIAERTAKACLILPLGGREQEEACDLADRVIVMARGEARDHWVMPWAKATRGLADYRRGRFAEALAWADRCLIHDAGIWNRELPAQLVRAMALSRLGRLDEARASLARASEVYRTLVAKPGGPADGGDWHDQVICEALRSEAEALLPDPTLPADPFAR